MNNNRKVWFITGAGRGMGADLAQAVLAAGDAVVATGRDPDRIVAALGHTENLLPLKLDVTSRADAEAAVRAAVTRFGRIDVLVNNAASFYAGYFEELTPEQVDRQLAVSLIGPMNITRAVLPVMREQRSGHIISISSSAGLAAGFDFVSAYAASKFGLEGWMESLHAEISPFGLTTTIVNPGFFRTELLTAQSTNYAEPSVADYDERRGALLEGTFELRVPGVRAARVSQTNQEPIHYVQRSTLCIVAQGAKIVMIGADTYGYEAGQMAVYSIDVPMAGRVTRGSLAEPYLLLMLDLDAEKIAELVPKVFPHGLPQPRDSRSLYVGEADAHIVVNIEELAKLVNMSVTSFHGQFKAVTGMSPLRYQKTLRLQEARRLMLATMMDAGRAGQRVGYGSASQFSREYSRFFGNAPAKDVNRLRRRLAR